MGRNENPVDTSAPHRGRLAQTLRRHRRTAGLTYAELAQRTGVSAATLKRAASGVRVPKLVTAETIATACGGGPEAVREAAELWRLARIEERGRLKSLHAPRPNLISDAGDLSKALELAWEQAGAPTLREIRARSGNKHALPVSSVARIVNRQALPADPQQLQAFLRGCGIPDDKHTPWLNAWNKITSKPAPATAPASRPALADTGRLLRKWQLHTQLAAALEEATADSTSREPWDEPWNKTHRLRAKALLAQEAERNGLASDVEIRYPDGTVVSLQAKHSRLRQIPGAAGSAPAKPSAAPPSRVVRWAPRPARQSA